MQLEFTSHLNLKDRNNEILKAEIAKYIYFTGGFGL